ncbi:hypothetical protein J3F84DRAFT_360114 [Trichoderma pleuroticola]
MPPCCRLFKVMLLFFSFFLFLPSEEGVSTASSTSTCSYMQTTNPKLHSPSPDFASTCLILVQKSPSFLFAKLLVPMYTVPRAHQHFPLYGYMASLYSPHHFPSMDTSETWPQVPLDHPPWSAPRKKRKK